MADIRVVQYSDLTTVTLDWLLTPAGTLDDTQQLASAIIIAIGTDRRALDTDELPNLNDGDQRGWWGDLNADTIWNGWPIGTRLWLLGRSKITGVAAKDGSTINKIQSYLMEALQPFVTLGVASAVTVSAMRTARNEIQALVTMYRGPKAAIQLQFDDLWSAIAAPPASIPPRPSPVPPLPGLFTRLRAGAPLDLGSVTQSSKRSEDLGSVADPVTDSVDLGTVP